MALFMNEQIFQLTLATLAVLLTIIGFFCSFIIYSIYQRLGSMEDKILSLLSKVEVQDNKLTTHSSYITNIFSELKEKCDLSSCPHKLQERYK